MRDAISLEHDLSALTAPGARRPGVKRTTLELITPLLEELRRHPALHEVRPTQFHVNGRDFLHFHDAPDGVFADIRLAKGFRRLPVTSRSEQSELLGLVDDLLSSKDSRVEGKRRRERRNQNDD
jgi:hypothetical protein